MGTVFRATCPTCNYEEQFCLGSGLGGINLLSCIRASSEREQTEIKKMYDNNEITSYVVEKKLTECHHCHTYNKLQDKTIITIIDQRGQCLVYGGQCHDCRRELHIYDEEVDKDSAKVTCPSCAESFLIIYKEGLWG